MDPSREILFGLMALQVGLVDQAQFLATVRACCRDGDWPLRDELVARGVLDPEECALLATLVAKDLKRHGGEVRNSLAALPVDPSTRSCLATIGDFGGDSESATTLADLEQGNTQAGVATGQDTSYTVGAATGDGQRFRILRPHARGGLGSVFVALDLELNREVALKQILDHHADEPASRQRFVLEAEVTGGLEHPGIVPVYGLGTYSDGRPYYAMRFIRGVSLKEAIDRFHVLEPRSGPLSVRTRARSAADETSRGLELRRLLHRFLDVCNTMDYAHSRGVLHRDIKPGNIIVGKHGETLVVDWGLAKATGRGEADAEEHTLLPGSASGSTDTLPGSTLGTPAYMSPEQARGDLQALGPRSDVYSLGATLYCILTGKPPLEGGDVVVLLPKAERGEFPRPRELDPLIDPALEAVCLRAMATNAADRYPSSRALADDIERWMADEPVSAYREPISRRARRWAMRNRTAVTAAAGALVAGVVGLTSVLIVQTQAKADIAEALRREMLANLALGTANDELGRSKAAVQAQYELAMEAIRTFHTGVAEDFLLSEDKFKALRDNLLRSAADFYTRLEGLLKDRTDRSSRAALAQAYFELGRLTSRIGTQPDALAVHRQALAIRRGLAARPAADADAMADVARSLQQVGLLQEAMGDATAALASYGEGVRICDAIARAGTLLDPVASVKSDILFDSGWLQSQVDRPERALASYLACRTIRQQLADSHPSAKEHRSNLASTDVALGILQADTGQPSAALGSFERACDVLRALSRTYPDDMRIKRSLGPALNELGLLLSQIGRSAEGLEAYHECLAIWQEVESKHPAVTEFRSRVALIESNIGVLHAEAGRWQEALGWLRKALEIRQQLADASPSAINHQKNLAFSLNSLVDTLDHLGRPGEAQKLLERTMRIGQRLTSGHPDDVPFAEIFANSLGLAGRFKQRANQPVQAAALYRRAIAMTEVITRIQPNGVHHFSLAALRSQLAGVALIDSSAVASAEARAAADRAIEDLRRSIRSGYDKVQEILHDKEFDPLRSRADFQLLVNDLSFPANSLAP
jgi:serine/threonine-protein kinase